MMTQTTGLQIESIEEVNQILHEITEYTVYGLAEPDVRVKQFYLERIWLSLGMSLEHIRERLKWIEIGVSPESEDYKNGQ